VIKRRSVTPLMSNRSTAYRADQRRDPAPINNNMHDSVKISGDGRQMWEARLWTAMNNFKVYRSNFWWSID
jgi:hypothetical protein